MLVVLTAGLCVLLISAARGSAATSTVYTWGQPRAPNGAVDKKQTLPTALASIPNPVVQVVATNSDDYALDDTGQVWAWGAARNGELGDGQPSASHPAYVSTPTLVQFPAGVTIASLTDTMPNATAMAIDTNGNVWGWGYNHTAELCLKTQNITAPVMVPLSNVSLASGAGDHALYDSGGVVDACGANGNGDLGDGSMTPNGSSTPVRVRGLPAEDVADLVTSFHNSGALMADGSYYDWGLGGQGQLGDGLLTDSDLPVAVALPAPPVQVSLGGSLVSNGQTVALLSDGSVWMWGSGQYGQLGDGQTANAPLPVPVNVPAGVSFVSVDSGGASAYAVDSTGQGWAWGQNSVGQLGSGGADTMAHALPSPLSLGAPLSEISSTAYNAIAQ